MRRRSVPLGILLPIALLCLVVSLAALQYKWVGTVSEAEREDLRQTLDRRALEFAREFDREITRAHIAFQAAADRVSLDDVAPFATRVEGWRTTAAYPGLVKGIYYARDPENTKGSPFFEFAGDTRQFRPVDWPISLAAIQRHVMHGPVPLPSNLPPGMQIVTMTGVMSLMPDVPAFVLPVRTSPRMPDAREKIVIETTVRRAEEIAAAHGAGAARGSVAVEDFRSRQDRNFLIVDLDAAYVRQTMLPAIASKHFPSSERYRVAILDNSSTPVLTRNLSSPSIERADVIQPFFRIRPELLAENAVTTWTTLGNSAVSVRGAAIGDQFLMFERAATTATPLRTVARPAGWRVLLQHAAGSLEAAVTQARVRNLWLSFGILAALAASVGLIVFNARRSEKLAAQQMDFVATVSHELRTPLAVIRSAAQNLSAGVVHESEQARRYGDLIETEGRRLTDMVEQVLEYAGLSGHRGPRLARLSDVGSIVREAVSSCEALFAAEGFSVDVDVAPGLPAVLVDDDALRRALNNLISNAMKYGADGRWFAVSARSAGAKGREEVQISVSDRGLGIEPQDLAHLFEPFYRGRRAVERQIHGNGLGLSLVKRIAESHGGRITVKSVPGEGATFVLHLPAAPPEALSTLAEPATDPGSPA